MIRRQHIVECHRSVFGMNEFSRIVLRRNRFEQSHPTIMQHLEHGERRLDRRGPTVVELRPSRFVIRFDRRRVFGQRPLESDVRVRVTVGDMVHDLPNGPAVGTIRRVELRIVETANGGAQFRRRRGDRIDGGATLGLGEGRRSLESAHRVAKIFHGSRLSGVEGEGHGAARTLVICSGTQRRHA